MTFKKSPRIYIVLACTLSLFTVATKTFAQAPPIIWQRCYGGDSTDVIDCIKQTSDGGYIAAGSTRSTNGDLATNGGVKGLWVLKLDPWGQIQWEKTYSDTLFGTVYIEPTSDGGYILTGNHTIKLHMDGSIDWLDNLQGTKIHQTTDGGFILCHYMDPGLIRLNADGSIAWQRNYNINTLGYQYIIKDVCQSFVSGYIVTGTIYDIFGSPFLSKTDDSGNIVAPTNSGYTHGSELLICKTTDNNYIVAGFNNRLNTISKITDSCAAFWTENPNAITFLGFTSIAATMDGGALACGGNSSSVANAEVLKYDGSGNLQWGKSMGGSLEDMGNSAFQATNGNYVMAGYTSSNDSDVSGNHGLQDGWIVEFGSNLATPVVPNNPAEIHIYPIPAMNVVNIDLPTGFQNATLKLMDVSGRAAPAPEDNNGLSRTLNLSSLAPGAYLLQVFNKGNYYSSKIIHY